MSKDDNKVIPIGGYTRLPLNPDTVLEAAKGKTEHCLILGFGAEQMLTYVAASSSDKRWLLMAIEEFKHKLLAGDYD
jgi:hypothetical protein